MCCALAPTMYNGACSHRVAYQLRPRHTHVMFTFHSLISLSVRIAMVSSLFSSQTCRKSESIFRLAHAARDFKFSSSLVEINNRSRYYHKVNGRRPRERCKSRKFCVWCLSLLMKMENVAFNRRLSIMVLLFKWETSLCGWGDSAFMLLFVQSHPHTRSYLAGWLVDCARQQEVLQKFTALRPLLQPQVGLISHYCAGTAQYGCKSLSCWAVKSTATCKVASALEFYCFTSILRVTLHPLMKVRVNSILQSMRQSFNSYLLPFKYHSARHPP